MVSDTVLLPQTHTNALSWKNKTTRHWKHWKFDNVKEAASGAPAETAENGFGVCQNLNSLVRACMCVCVCLCARQQCKDPGRAETTAQASLNRISKRASACRASKPKHTPRHGEKPRGSGDPYSREVDREGRFIFRAPRYRQLPPVLCLLWFPLPPAASCYHVLTNDFLEN